jgi:hypothetical protein
MSKKQCRILASLSLAVIIASCSPAKTLRAQQEVKAPGAQAPGAPLPRYVYNVIAADFSVTNGYPPLKSKVNLYDPVGPTIEQFDSNITKMGELNVDTYRIELAWDRQRSGLATNTGVGGASSKLEFNFEPFPEALCNDARGSTGSPSSRAASKRWPPLTAGVLIWNRGAYARRLDVHLDNLPFRQGTVKLYRIDEKHASWLDGAPEDLVARGTYPFDSQNWSWADGSIPRGGVLYVEASDDIPEPVTTSVDVAKIIRINRYYPARGETARYADFNRKTWIARLGMEGSRQAD